MCVAPGCVVHPVYAVRGCHTGAGGSRVPRGAGAAQGICTGDPDGARACVWGIGGGGPGDPGTTRIVLEVRCCCGGEHPTIAVVISTNHCIHRPEELAHRIQLLRASHVPVTAALTAPALLTASPQHIVGPRLAFLRARQPQLLRRPDVLQQCLQCSDVEFVEGYAQGLLEEYVVFQVARM